MNLDQIKADILGDWEEQHRRISFGHPVGASPQVESCATTSLTLIGPRLLDDFRELIERAVAEDVPGHIVETGVWRGGACIWAAAVLENLGVTNRMVYVCDSFQGLPPVSNSRETIDFSDDAGLAVSMDEVQANFDRFGLRHRTVCVPGWFKDTIPLLDLPVAVLRLDGDMYESTDDVLRHMYQRVSPGGYVIVDDYQLPSCRRAVDECRSRNRVRGSLPLRAGAWWKKP